MYSKPVCKVLKAIQGAVQALIRPEGPANQECQQTRGLSQSGWSCLLRVLAGVPRALQAYCRDWMAVRHVLEAW